MARRPKFRQSLYRGGSTLGPGRPGGYSGSVDWNSQPDSCSAWENDSGFLFWRGESTESLDSTTRFIRGGRVKQDQYRTDRNLQWRFYKHVALTRRNFLELAAMSATARLAAAIDTPHPAVAPTRQPNIILMLGDDHRADVLGCLDHPVIKTPELDRLASDGVLFPNHFCTTPICCVSRASIMLGQYASTHGINDFKTSLTPAQIGRSYYGRMRKAGYHTGFIGKFGVGDHMPADSFDVWNGFPAQGFYFPQGESGPHLTDIQRDQANAFLLGAPRDKPFCLSISFKAPHVQDEDPRQYLPSKETLSLYEDIQVPPPRGAAAEDILRFPLPFQRSENRRRWGIRFATPEIYQASTKGYYRLINGIDAAIGSMRRTLQQQGLAENTVIIYSADHGIFNGEHGFAGKWYAHEESIRIPLIVYDPRLPSSANGKRSPGMSLNIDLHPTLLELAGLPPPEGTQGRSLLAQLRGEDYPMRDVWFVEHQFPLKGFIPSSNAIRTRRWKYIRYTDVAAPFEELYDLQGDRSEMHNLVGSPQHTHQLHAMQRYCTTWKASFAAEDDSWREPVTAADLTRDGLT